MFVYCRISSINQSASLDLAVQSASLQALGVICFINDLKHSNNVNGTALSQKNRGNASTNDYFAEEQNEDSLKQITAPKSNQIYSALHVAFRNSFRENLGGISWL